VEGAYFRNVPPTNGIFATSVLRRVHDRHVHIGARFNQPQTPLLTDILIDNSIMSVTTTTNPLTYNLSSVLADYDLHHTAESLDTSLNPHPAPTPPSQNPSDWPTEHRRVPAFRPVNTQLDQSERRVYQNGAERTFILVMFTGVYIESVSWT
jgi:hypothetical protein